MRQCMDADNLHRRLSKIIGQVQAIDRMIDEDIPCEDVLAQINAAKSALHKVGQVVLEGHINHCVRDGIEHGDADKEDFDETVYGQIGTYLGIRRHKKRDCRIRHFRSRLGFQPFWT